MEVINKAGQLIILIKQPHSNYGDFLHLTHTFTSAKAQAHMDKHPDTQSYQ